jgi:hypothetical protein
MLNYYATELRRRKRAEEAKEKCKTKHGIGLDVVAIPRA